MKRRKWRYDQMLSSFSRSLVYKLWKPFANLQHSVQIMKAIRKLTTLKKNCSSLLQVKSMWFKNGDLANNIPSINGISQSPDEKACGEHNLSGVG